MLQMIIEAVILTLACSVDSAVTGFSYGLKKNRIKFIYALIISIICSFCLALSLFLGAALSRAMPATLTTIISISILSIVGGYKILESIFNKKKDEELKNLSIKSAAVIALILSIDGIAAGFGAGLLGLSWLSYIIIISISIVLNTTLLLSGALLGNKASKRTSLNLSWISGVLLIALAISQIFF